MASIQLHFRIIIYIFEIYRYPFKYIWVPCINYNYIHSCCLRNSNCQFYCDVGKRTNPEQLGALDFVPKVKYGGNFVTYKSFSHKKSRSKWLRGFNDHDTLQCLTRLRQVFENGHFWERTLSCSSKTRTRFLSFPTVIRVNTTYYTPCAVHHVNK